MGHYWDEVPEKEVEWIRNQQIFWVATAPTSPNGHVNLSPKSVEGTFKLLNPKQFYYQDLTGSGSETAAHIRDNGRITIMFSALDGTPKIIRLYGTAKMFERNTPEYGAILPVGDRLVSSRSVIFVDIYKVGKSCGWGIPYFSFEKPRRTLTTMLSRMDALDIATPDKQVPGGLRKYQGDWNYESLDGLPAYEFARKLALEDGRKVEWGKGKGGLGRKCRGAGSWDKQLIFVSGMIFGLVMAVMFVQFIASDQSKRFIQLHA